MTDQNQEKLRQRLVIDELANQFESQLRAGESPQVEDYLVGVDLAIQPNLIAELIRIECELGGGLDTDKVNAYRKRFPAIIDNVINKYLGQTQSTITNQSPTRRGQTPKKIGPFKILQKIGEGGMGTVYMADQEKPVRRRVALKIIKAELVDRKIIARFEAERQALAMMEHNNIAKVLDSGTTENGSPYFVMELIQGIPINEYCDRNRLTLAQRLEVFLPVCQAIQHAHQKGIIHRDLKPSNVIVQIYDGAPVPKVIDFGLAKAVQHQTKLTDKTLFTEFKQIVGTLQYMSPEQAMLDALNVDTRSDVYSLGVMLYELLAGSTPLEKDTLVNNPVLSVLEIIREKDPPRPSHRLSSIGNSLSEISKLRQIQPKKLQQILRGELDWIIMKALEKDRTRRYETASAFAEDIRRYLNREPIVARPPSLGYQLRKSIQRNKGPVFAACLVFLLLMAGLIGTGYMWLRAEEAERQAVIEKNRALNEERNARDAEKLARESEALAIAAEVEQRKAKEEVERQRDLAQDLTNQMKQEVEKAKFLSDFLITMLKTADPILQGSVPGVVPRAGADVTVKEILDSSAKRIAEMAEFPEVRAQLMGTIGSAYVQLGFFQEAESLLEESVRIREELLPSSRELAESLHYYGWLYHEQGNYPKAISFYDRALTIRKTLAGDEGQRLYAESLQFKAWLIGNEGFAQESRKLFEEVLAIRSKILGPTHRDTLFTRFGICFVCIEMNAYVTALQQLTAIGPNLDSIVSDPNLTDATYSFAKAVLRERLGVAGGIALGDSEKNFRRAIIRCEKGLGAENIYVALIRAELGQLLQKRNRLEEAEEEFKIALQIGRDRVNLEHPRIAILVKRYSNLLRKTDRTDEGLEIWNELISSLENKFDPRYSPLLMARVDYGDFLRLAGKSGLALVQYQKVIDAVKMSQQNNLGYRYLPWVLGSVLNKAAVCYDVEGDRAASVNFYNQAIAAYHAADYDEDRKQRDIGWPSVNLVWAYIKDDQLEFAKEKIDQLDWIENLKSNDTASRLKAFRLKTVMHIEVLNGSLDQALTTGKKWFRLILKSESKLLDLANECCNAVDQLGTSNEELFKSFKQLAFKAIRAAHKVGAKKIDLGKFPKLEVLNDDPDYESLIGSLKMEIKK